jgi:LemA protein
MLWMIVLAALLIAAIFYGILIYNHLITLKNNITKNWSNIDVLLKQRYSELPKLIDACKKYMQYESETLDKIVSARNLALKAMQTRDITTLSTAETTLKSTLGHLFALAENYPALKTNETFQKLQIRISELESDISDRRELYNESVNLNNIRIAQFPDVIVAKLFGFAPFTLMKFSEDELQDVNITSSFGAGIQSK